jgi:hypothetical protein
VNNRSGRPRYFNSIGDMVGAMETKRLLLIRLKIISSIEGTIIPYLETLPNNISLPKSVVNSDG